MYIQVTVKLVPVDGGDSLPTGRLINTVCLNLNERDQVSNSDSEDD